jgi:hypothetical protein
MRTVLQEIAAKTTQAQETAGLTTVSDSLSTLGAP